MHDLHKIFLKNKLFKKKGKKRDEFTHCLEEILLF